MINAKIAGLVDNLLSVNDAANPSLTYTTTEDIIREAAELCAQIVLEQDTMIEIEAPVNVLHLSNRFVVIYMASTQIYYGYSIDVVTRLTVPTFFLAIILTEVVNS
ncbi:hypothetical protein GCK32_017127 [Trichostrongylus colubriformis]|uniref:Uncharacterized protein n=1 Tax=Trichostrongylus colubriformis TaxID=6319 RepID=A0AAN8FZJ6_TRICO